MPRAPAGSTTAENPQGRDFNIPPARTRAEYEERRARAYQVHRPQIITPRNPAGANAGPDSDSDDNEEEEELDREREFAEGFTRGPLDEDPNDQWSDSESGNEDPNLHIVFNDGRTLQHVAVARYFFEGRPEGSGEDSEDEDAELEVMLRVEELLAEREVLWAERQRNRATQRHGGARSRAYRALQMQAQQLQGEDTAQLFLQVARGVTRQ